ncbi:hypothetical protein [Rhodospira trueperi]|uniref:hypothetical protein n=1 Tax=Rhodospira trueperi TaxID=69960 RepID=UPI00115FC2C6|nr:hypothetical protein [Rhodospira trueperi]
MPNYQGQLDGLCGPYAIVNAFEHCGIDAHQNIFETACGAISQKRWPNVLWEGTTIGDLKRMIKRCRERIDGAEQIKTRYPFSRNPPKNNKKYWDRFDNLFESNANVRCMILGLTRPSYHWIVAYCGEGTRVNFVDTDPMKPFQRKNRTSLHAGSRNGNPNKWIIEPRELILFESE